MFFVPESPFNLLSLSRLTRSLDCLISFTKDSVFLQDWSSGRMIGIGCESHGLYHLRTSAPAGLVVDSPSLIHAQLSHPSLAKLQHLVSHLSKLSHLSCESCQLGKYSHNSFSRSVPNRALSLFALVHSNIWGPSWVRSTLGFQYFVTFIDDYSLCTWLFLMKTRSKLFSIFQSFYNKIQNQFGVSIRKFHNDNSP
uniref:Retrovirus-related Pol polyprotein from transposon TNT 1-94 n=1 Tax=Cajanus cajan TaxID=3821 RepID=A0A151TE92_CAJCA|nr:Retrovirus-related Pol polyprotein from transposon TNT 1-94 [Cajanus cajan]KYP65370.1 Retrovirus-related Pol polyprotein from transposon TNT 1-94 [Cajanus cajan]